jgi:UV excision repair protein RAD23
MKLTVKTLQQKTFHIESLEQDNVLDLKKKIQESQGFSTELQKLIHSGKILNDESMVKDLNIQEKDFLVVMVTKPKAVSVPAATVAQTSLPATAIASGPVPAATVPTPSPAPVAAPITAPITAPVTAPITAASNQAQDSGLVQTDTTLATGTAYEAAVTGLVEMGFERAQVVRAMRAAFNNPDRAAEYLMTVISVIFLKKLGNS